MKLNRRAIMVGAAIVALAAGGAGIAQAIGGDSEEQVTGPAAEKAKAAALKAAGGGTVLEVERQDGDGAGVFEVEIRRADGSQVEIHLDAGYKPVGTAADDDTAGESEDDEGEGAGSDN
ncbi:MAG: PepSY domain-containing protein [Gaiellaceae bacterium]